MESFERSGVTVERCTECGGLFLDRGELEHLVEAEAAGVEGAGSTPQPGGGDLLRQVLDAARQCRRGRRPS
jgi:Zn-finger nucleic acid-binding protein